MTKEDQKQLINDMCETLRKSLLSKVKDMPEYWDGRYIRQYIKDNAADCVWSSYKKPKEYNNDVLIHNL